MFLDENGDGERSASELPAANVTVLLDGRAPKTPAHAKLTLPTGAAAQLVADEWAAQGEFIEPGTMPATRLASTAIDLPPQAVKEWATSTFGTASKSVGPLRRRSRAF